MAVEFHLNAFTTLLVTLDPPGLATIFLGLTRGMSASQRKQVALIGPVIAFGILSLFAVFGSSILGGLGISIGAFRIAGGLMLFAIAFEMIFEKRNDRKEKSSEDIISNDHAHSIAVFPLAVPLIAGPGSISATMLLAATMPSAVERIELLAVIAVSIGVLLTALMIAHKLERLLGVIGRAILTRLLGVLLAALSVQFVLDGIKASFQLS